MVKVRRRSSEKENENEELSEEPWFGFGAAFFVFKLGLFQIIQSRDNERACFLSRDKETGLRGMVGA